MYRNNLLDEGIADQMLVPFARVLWKEADWYVKDRRADATRAEGPAAAARLLVNWEALIQSQKT
jgi:hypothetical protein